MGAQHRVFHRFESINSKWSLFIASVCIAMGVSMIGLNPFLKPLSRNAPFLVRSVSPASAPRAIALTTSPDQDGDANPEALRLAGLMSDANASRADRVDAAAKLLEIGSDEQVESAIEILASLGGSEAISLLSSLGRDANWPNKLRTQALDALGNIGTDEAKDTLLTLLGCISDPSLRAKVVTILGHNPSNDAVQALTKILNSHDPSPEVRAAAAEGLGQTTPAVLPVLKDLVASDPDPDVRANAAWAISTLGSGQSFGPDLASMAQREQDADVRRRIYEALLAQSDNQSGSLLPLINSETDHSALVAGFNALGDAVGRGSVSQDVATTFDSQIVPELTQIALSDDESVNLRTRAVFALRRAGTDVAIQALAQISQTQTPMVARAANNGLH